MLLDNIQYIIWGTAFQGVDTQDHHPPIAECALKFCLILSKTTPVMSFQPKGVAHSAHTGIALVQSVLQSVDPSLYDSPRIEIAVGQIPTCIRNEFNLAFRHILFKIGH